MHIPPRLGRWYYDLWLPPRWYAASELGGEILAPFNWQKRDSPRYRSSYSYRPFSREPATYLLAVLHLPEESKTYIPVS